MPLFLKHRQSDIQERMDNPDCDKKKLFNTYHSFKTINRLLSGWSKIYRKEIRPFLKINHGSCTILDIGFGGGDLPQKLVQLAEKDGFEISILAIDPDERSMEFAQTYHSKIENVIFRKAHSHDLINEELKYDFVISNHLLHHLSEQDLIALCEDAKQLASHKVLFNDIRRSDLGYIMFFFFSKIFFHRSFISYDGLISIKRSFTNLELSNIAPESWKVQKFHPFRLLLSYEKT